MSLSKKPVVLVTGGSRGIGLGIATALAERGFNIAINGRRDESDVMNALDAIRGAGAEALYCRADIADLDAHAGMLDSIRTRFGRLDSLVNNAGVAPDVREDILEASPESFDRLVKINLRGPYFLTQTASRWLISQKNEDESRTPTIVNVSSISATVVSVNRGDYCISKAGVGMATQLWAARLGADGIGVYEVRPGVTRTDMTSGVTEKYDKLIAEGLTVEPRWGTPDDVGRAVAVLASGELRYATGSVVMVDGGLTIPRM